MRLFISVEISDDLKEKIAQLQQKFREFDIKLVEKENLHFCLMFLGEVEEDKMVEIKEAMGKVANKFKKFEIKISGLNAFPNKNYINVIFLEVKDGKQMIVALAGALRQELSGFKSGKPFLPHLTLARNKSGDIRLKELVAKLEKTEIGRMTVDRIALIKSTLTPKGPEYEELFSASLF